MKSRIYAAALLISALTAISCQQQEAGSRTDAWPSFRGYRANGRAVHQDLPHAWDGKTGLTIIHTIAVPGLAHSSPVVWGGRLFVATAISSLDSVSFTHGLYGSGDASPDTSVHRWDVICYDTRTGDTVWQRTAFSGVPTDKRHIKSTYANATPATDGRYVVALFGSEGLVCYDLEGTRIWDKSLGRMDVGAYDAPEYEWGPASSPVIDGDLVFVQVDTQAEDFLIACDIRTGETVWKTMRDELPSWGTPTIVEWQGRKELVTNSSNSIYGYDPESGKELWRLGKSSQITAPTPVFADGLIVVASGRGPEAPIAVVRAGAEGDITPAEDGTGPSIAWYKLRRGPYMPTPLIYEGLLYVLNNNGRFDCYDLATGEECYRERIKHAGGGFSASPVAADGYIYLSGEDGQIFVVQAGRTFSQAAVNYMGERLMATPAIAGGRMYVKGEKHLFVIGKE
ncbi:PQQ-binding-like beta-propeller repeat protein [bacterium]|nr:PQQ-binding-like beta-propeller repeat protein [bacterium]